MELRGDDLETSVPLHYGLVNWTLGVEPMMKPNTRFMGPYLAAVGALQLLARDVDLELAVRMLYEELGGKSAREAFAAQETLYVRPLGRLLGDPHALAGFLGLHDGRLWKRSGAKVDFARESDRLPARDLPLPQHGADARASPRARRSGPTTTSCSASAEAFYARARDDARRARTGATARSSASASPSAASKLGGEAIARACDASHRGFQAARRSCS